MSIHPSSPLDGDGPGAASPRLTPGDPAVARTVLPGGLRVITESLPAVRSVAIGIWVGVGSRDEDLAHAGATHYLEHLLFKGTSKRTALEISAGLDAVGGELNAFTGKEFTCYYARVLDADLPLAIDVLCDMVTGSLIAPRDVDAERGVVLEEIAMNEDDPSDTVHEAFAAELFGDSPLGRPILGTVSSINAISREQIAEHYQAMYTPPHLVVAAAGNLSHDVVVDLVRQAFAGVTTGEAARLSPAPPRIGGQYAIPSRAAGDRTGADQTGADQTGAGDGGGPARPALRLVSRGIEQANLVLGCDGLSRTDDRRFALSVLNAALGGGMSSRLFQEVREKRGLAYSVYSFNSQLADTGIWGIYVGCLPAKADEVLAICQDEIAKVIGSGLSDVELERGKGQVRGSIVLGLEDPSSRMSRLGKSELVYPRLEPVDEILTSIEAVTHDQVREVASEVLGRSKVLAVVGPYDDADAFAATFG
ncbi:MAG TPA: pitrilysin family protein [Streptosporangiaceae bacterium]|nr:pitrilysin family protein [Streptosporangiaceae bacterium]